MPNIAIQLNRFLGDCVSERALLSELLDSDGGADMVDILDTWQIPSSPNLDLTLGTVYAASSTSANSRGRDKDSASSGLIGLQSPPERGDMVFWPGNSLENAATGAARTDLQLQFFRGRVEAVYAAPAVSVSASAATSLTTAVSGNISSSNSYTCVVTVDPEGTTREFSILSLRTLHATAPVDFHEEAKAAGKRRERGGAGDEGRDERGGVRD